MCYKKWFYYLNREPLAKEHRDRLPLHYQIAKQEIGTKEIKGLVHCPRIIEYHQTTSLKASSDEVPWCASYVNYCLIKSGKKGTKSAWSLSFLEYGTPIHPEKAMYGDIVIFQRGNPKDGKGHVGFFAGYSMNGACILVLGGNQNNSVCYKMYPTDKLLGVRRVK